MVVLLMIVGASDLVLFSALTPLVRSRKDFWSVKELAPITDRGFLW